MLTKRCSAMQATISVVCRQRVITVAGSKRQMVRAMAPTRRMWASFADDIESVIRAFLKV